jgi:polyvinyl alcohol dehydrogenase (cytochrome)
MKRHRIYFGTTNNYSSPSTRTSDSVLALDMASGRIAWSIQIEANDAWNGGCVSPNTAVLCPKQHGNDLGVGANTVLATTSDGRDLVVAGDKSGWVVAVDAESGAVAWKSKVGRGGMLAGVHFGLAANGDRVFVPVADSEDGQSHSEPARPGLYALDLRTGRSVWKAPDDHVDCRGRPPGCAPGLDAGLLVTSDMVIAGAIDGTLRAYDIQSGKIVWMFDMTRSTQTLGGGQAHGGSMGGAVAPVAYDGALYVLSGYGFGGKMPGNAMFMLEASH